MKIFEIRESFLKKNHNLNKALSALTQYNTILHEYAESLSTNELVDQIILKRNQVICTLRTFPVSFYISNRPGLLPIIAITGKFENQHALKMISMMSGKSTIFDIGANIGYYSIIAGKLFPKSKIYSFEPIPHSFFDLKANVELNGLNNIYLENYALMDTIGASEDFMYYPIDAPTESSFKNIRNREEIQAIKVQICTLDDYCLEKNIYPDFIKCDVEGAELSVLKGADKVLKAHHPVVFLEIVRNFCAKFDYTAADIVDLMKSYGYSMYVVRDTNLEPLETITDETVDTNFIFM